MNDLNVLVESRWRGKEIDLGGYRLHYIEKGQGEPLLLVHGLGAYSYTWRHNIKALASKFHVFAIDLKGFGFSDKPRGSGYSIDDQVRSVRGFMTRSGLEKVHFIGSSMGGEIGLRLCLDTPQLVDKLVLIGSSGFRDKLPYSIRILSYLPYKYFVRPLIKRKYLTEQSLVEIVKGAFYNPKAITDQELEQYLLPITNEDFERSFLTLLREFDFGKRKSDYHQIQHDILILAGEKDIVIPHNQSIRLAKELKNSTFVTIPRAGHFMHEEKPDEVNRLILRFLSTGSP